MGHFSKNEKCAKDIRDIKHIASFPFYTKLSKADYCQGNKR